LAQTWTELATSGFSWNRYNRHGPTTEPLLTLQEGVYLEPEASPMMSISSDNDTDSSKVGSEYYSELDPDVDMRMEDDVDAPDDVDFDGNVDMERDGEAEVEEDEEEDDEKEEEVVAEEEEEEKDMEEDNDEDDGKEPRTIGQGEMVNTSADDVDTMVDNQPIVIPEQGQEMCEHTTQPPPPAPAPWPQTPEPCP
jgi:hypothetical protein